jgi:hypothetical protein
MMKNKPVTRHERNAESQYQGFGVRRAETLSNTFDILWDEPARSDDEEEMRRFRNGEDSRYLPLN